MPSLSTTVSASTALPLLFKPVTLPSLLRKAFPNRIEPYPTEHFTLLFPHHTTIETTKANTLRGIVIITLCGLLDCLFDLFLPNRRLIRVIPYRRSIPQRFTQRALLGFFDFPDFLFPLFGSCKSGGRGITFGIPREVFVLLPPTNRCHKGMAQIVLSVL